MKAARELVLVAFYTAFALTAPARAQPLIPLGGTVAPAPYRTTKPGVETPLIADTVLQTFDRTPWGTFTQVLKGKFYRTRDGKCRQDFPYGHTSLIMLPNDFWLDHELKTIQVLVGDTSLPGTDGVYFDGGSIGTLGGRKVIGGERRGEPSGTLRERWLDYQWGVIVQWGWKRPVSDFVLQMINIQERDPDPDLFKIPDGYTVVSCQPASPQHKAKLPAFCPNSSHPGKK